MADEHRNPIFMADLVYTFTGIRTAGSASDTSNYREGKIEGSVNLPFNDPACISAFDDTVKHRYGEALDRIRQFAEWHLNPEMAVWFIKAALDIIENDDTIREEDLFYIRGDGTPVSKAEMRTETRFEPDPFLLGVLHYILVYRANKNHLGIPTLDANSEKKSYSERQYTGQLGSSITRTITTDTIPSKKLITRGAGVIQRFSTQYYQLLVTNEKDVFVNNIVTVSKNRVLSNAPAEILQRCASLSEEGIEELKTFPAIVCRENTGYYGKTDPNQTAVYGYVRLIKTGQWKIKVAFHPIALLYQRILCEKKYAIYFDLDMDCAVTDLNHSAWSVHKVNLFEAFNEAGIVGMPRPS